jgi:hypothetical protein
LTLCTPATVGLLGRLGMQSVVIWVRLTPEMGREEERIAHMGDPLTALLVQVES